MGCEGLSDLWTRHQVWETTIHAQTSALQSALVSGFGRGFYPHRPKHGEVGDQRFHEWQTQAFNVSDAYRVLGRAIHSIARAKHPRAGPSVG